MPPRRKKAKEASRGLAAADVAAGDRPLPVERLREQIESDGGSVLSVFRDPLGGHWQILAALPVDRVAPTPFQRDLSEAHVKRLTNVIDGLGRFLDPIIAVRAKDGGYWTPNGHHRLSAMRKLGARSIVALVLPEAEIAYRILALNTEKAHNLRERSLEVIRMARDLAGLRADVAGDLRSPGPLPEKDYALDFEEPALLTLGVCYEQNGRFPGGAYHPVLKRVDEFFEEKLPKALEKREKRAAPVMELEERGRRGNQGAPGEGIPEPLPAGVRRRADQPAPVPEGGEGDVRSDDREDARLGEEVQCGVGEGGSARADRRRSRGMIRSNREGVV